jgi:hypothetical protein
MGVLQRPFVRSISPHSLAPHLPSSTNSNASTADDVGLPSTNMPLPTMITIRPGGHDELAVDEDTNDGILSAARVLLSLAPSAARPLSPRLSTTTAIAVTSSDSIRLLLAPPKPTSVVASSASTPTTSNVSNERYFAGATTLSLPEDEESLSPAHCFMRRYCVEVFATSCDESNPSEDIQSTGSGSSTSGSKKVAPLQVGIRCLHCKHRPCSERIERSVCYPSSIRNIYHGMEAWQRRHALSCLDLPEWIRSCLVQLMENNRTSAGGRRKYWETAAQRIGLIDAPQGGIRFIYPPGTILSNEEVQKRNSKKTIMGAPNSAPRAEPALVMTLPGVPGTTESMVVDEPSQGGSLCGHPRSVCTKRLVTEDDRKLVTEYLFTLLQQMEPCTFQEEDRTGGRSKVKDFAVGYPGLQCCHCKGMAGCGRYFPSHLSALASANSDRNLHNHLTKCRKCPTSVQKRLEELQTHQEDQDQPEPTTSLVYQNSKTTKPGASPNVTVPSSAAIKYNKNGTIKNRRGSRKLFFQLVWDRLHGLPSKTDSEAGPEEDCEMTRVHEKDVVSPRPSLTTGHNSMATTVLVSDDAIMPVVNTLHPLTTTSDSTSSVSITSHHQRTNSDASYNSHSTWMSSQCPSVIPSGKAWDQHLGHYASSLQPYSTGACTFGSQRYAPGEHPRDSGCLGQGSGHLHPLRPVASFSPDYNALSPGPCTSFGSLRQPQPRNLGLYPYQRPPVAPLSRQVHQRQPAATQASPLRPQQWRYSAV